MSLAKAVNQDRNQAIEYGEIFVSTLATSGVEKQIRGYRVGIISGEVEDQEILGRYISKERAVEVFLNMMHVIDQKPLAVYNMPKE